MFSEIQKSTGTRYTTTVVFLIIALIFCPAYWAFVHPIGILGNSLLCSAGAISLTLAWVSWKRYSRHTMPSLGQ